MKREDFLDLLRRSNPRTRRTVVRVIEGKAEQDDATFVQEEIEMVEPDMTTRTVNYIGMRTCSMGHALDKDCHVVGRCEVCGGYICSSCAGGEQGLSCRRCRRALCPKHAHVLCGEVFCRRCWPFAAVARFARWFFDVGGKERK